MNKKEVIKHSAAIHISNKLSLLQRRAWNVLLANAFDDLNKKDQFTISLRELCDILAYDSNDIDYIKRILKDLVGTYVEWNILEKDKKRWGVASLLAQAEIIDSTLVYGYAPIIRERLYNPAMYAKISLILQNKFSSKHTLALYELFVDYFNIKLGFGETPFIEIEKFRKLCGLKEDEYKEFKELNKFVIKKSINEINSNSDLLIKIEYKKELRKVVAVKFHIQKNPNSTINIEKIANAAQKIHKALPFPEFDEPDTSTVSAAFNQNLFETLTDEFGISKNKASAILKSKDEFYIQEILAVVREDIRAGKVKDIPAFTVRAVEDDYRRNKPMFFREKEKQEEEKRRAQEELRIIDNLRMDFEENITKKSEEVIKQIPDDEMDRLIADFEKEEIEIGNDIIKRSFKKGGIESPVIRPFFRTYLVGKFLPKVDHDFLTYAWAKGYKLERKDDGKYRMITESSKD